MKRHSLRKLTYGWTLVVVLAGWMVYDQVASSVVTTLTCDRAANTCALSGGSQAKVPPPSQIKRAELRVRHIHREGDGYDIYLDEQSINPQPAQADDAIASYRRAVDTINAFLRDPAQPHVEASFTYWASLSEKITAVLILLGTLAVMAFLVILGRQPDDRG